LFLLLEDTPDTLEQRERLERNDRRLNLEVRREPHFYRTPAGWRECLAEHRFSVLVEMPFERVFPRATWTPVPHQLFVCRNDTGCR
jgi:peptidoglycan/xylan/chitin deacetylase (PgdA/CDA1 family)